MLALAALLACTPGNADDVEVSDPDPAAGDDSAAPADPWAALAGEAVLHYGFEALAAPDQVLDDSPSGLHGTAWEEDDVFSRVTTGPHGNALTFDGVSDFVFVADAPALDLAGPFTLLAWMRADPREGPRAFPILDKYAYVAGNWTGYGAWLDGGQPYAGVYAGAETATECGGPALGVFDDGEWHLYAAIFDGAALGVTVDGQTAATCAWALPSTPNRDFLEVGTRGGEFFFHGALDEVTVLPRALTEDEVLGLL